MQGNLHDAKTHLSHYVDQALVRLMPVADEQPPRRLGFLAGTARIDADLKRDFEDEINAMFDLGPEQAADQGITGA
jgi:hypothetical protein